MHQLEGEGPKQNAEAGTPLLVLGAVFPVSNPARVFARGVHGVSHELRS